MRLGAVTVALCVVAYAAGRRSARVDGERFETYLEATDEDESVRVCNDVLWLANNMHNYGSDGWRSHFMACVRDARAVVGYERVP